VSGDKGAKKKSKKEERLVVLTEEERLALIEQLTAEMKSAASLLEFEKAAELRDRIESLKG
jgi:excinuclease ABC subunit B